MTRQKVYVTRNIVPEAIEKLGKIFDIEVWEKPTPAPKDLIIQKAQEFDGMMIESNEIMDSEVFGSADKLNVFGNSAIG